MSNTINIAHIADIHLRTSQYGRLARGHDFFAGFKHAVEAAISAQADAIICAGDVVDTTRPSADVISHQLGEIAHILEVANMPMFVISGNHDLTTPHWCTSAHSHYITVIDNQTVNVCGVLSIHGLPFMSPDNLRVALCEAPEADILVWHGEVKEFCGYPKMNSIEINDFPRGKWKLIAMGDQHIHKMITRESDGMVVAYPGSTELCSSSEEAQKKIYMHTFDAATKQLIGTRSIEFPTRPVQRFTINTDVDIEQALVEIVPGALVFVDYNPLVQNVVPRLNIAATEKSVIQATPLMSIKQDMSTAGKVDEVISLDPVAFIKNHLTDLISETDCARVADLCVAFADSGMDHKYALDRYCSDRLGAINV